MNALRPAAAMLIAIRAIVLAFEIATLAADLAIQRAIVSNDMSVPRWFIVVQLWLDSHFMSLVYLAGLATLVAVASLAAKADRIARSPAPGATAFIPLLLAAFCVPILNLVLPWIILAVVRYRLKRRLGLAAGKDWFDVPTIVSAFVFDTCLLINGRINGPDLQVTVLRHVPTYAEFPVLLNSEEHVIRCVEIAIAFALLAISVFYGRSLVSLSQRRDALVAEVFDPQ